MSFGGRKPQEGGSSDPMTPETKDQDPGNLDTPQEQGNQKRGDHKHQKPKESKVHRLSQGGGLYTPKKQEKPIKPALLTAEQYLRKASMDKGIADLVRSLHKTRVATFEEWERETSALIKKRIL